MISNRAMKEEFNPFKKTKDKLKYDVIFRRDNPTYFWPDGLVVYCGPQGSGKTLSAVNYIYNLMEMYPKAKLVTNITLKDYPAITFSEFLNNLKPKLDFSDLSEVEIEEELVYWEEQYYKNNKIFPFLDADDLTKVSNGKEGVIFLIDEIQLYFNSLESKNINIEVMTQISQQRKQRKHIVCTSQVFGRMAKPLREQFSAVMVCKGYFNLVQKCSLVDRDSLDGEESTGTNLKGEVIKNFWYIRSPQMFERYDTYAVIKNSKIKASTNERNDIYGSRLSSNS